MANRQKGEVSFRAGDRGLTLVYDTNALCELEEATGKGAMAVMLEMQEWAPPLGEDGKPVAESSVMMQARVGRMRMSTVRAVLWAGLRRHHPHLTIADAGDVIEDMGGLAPAMEKIGLAFGAAFPDAGASSGDSDARPPQAVPTPSTGTAF